MRHKWIATGFAALLFMIVFGLNGLAVGIDGTFSAYLPLLSKPVPTPTPTATATPQPTNTPVPAATATNTPTATATSGPQPTGNVDIVDIFYDGLEPRTEGDEYVEIRNNDSVGIQLQGWTLRDNASPPHVFTFPSFVMQPGQTCRVYTDEYHPTWCGFNYGSSSAIWNNDGDCAHLRNSIGVEVDQYCYP